MDGDSDCFLSADGRRFFIGNDMSDDLTLEKLKINEKLDENTRAISTLTNEIGKITVYMENQRSNCSNSMGVVSAMIEKHNHLLYGNDDKGLKEKVGEIEKTTGDLVEERKRWMSQIIYIWVSILLAISSLAVKWIFTKVVHGG